MRVGRSTAAHRPTAPQQARQGRTPRVEPPYFLSVFH